jgi:hypothetical protein
VCDSLFFFTVVIADGSAPAITFFSLISMESTLYEKPGSFHTRAVLQQQCEVKTHLLAFSVLFAHQHSVVSGVGAWWLSVAVPGM